MLGLDAARSAVMVVKHPAGADFHMLSDEELSNDECNNDEPVP